MPRVSVITIFLNAAPFLAEAIESVVAQTFKDWELLLVDDGSTDGSSEIARSYAQRLAGKIRYTEHPAHENRGMSASRNAGIQLATGDYIALLDADDVWFPEKLTEQVAIMDAQPRAAMIYGASEGWYSWSGAESDRARDRIRPIRVPSETLFEPPTLFIEFLSRKVPTPCPSSMLLRRSALEQFGGFEEQFRGMYEDQVLDSKIALHAPIYVSGKCWDRYRRHAVSCYTATKSSGGAVEARRFFLVWLAGYVAAQRVRDRAVLHAVAKEQWRLRHPKLYRAQRAGKDGLKVTLGSLKKTVRRLIPPRGRAWYSYLRGRGPKPLARIDLGELRRVTPVSTNWGFDRGLPIDRYYIEKFLGANASDITGRALEVRDNNYTTKFGGDRVTRSDVLHVRTDNPRATIVADLTDAPQIASEIFDCIILTQTLQFIYDSRAAIQTLHRILKPGGVLLVTVPGISKVSRSDTERWGDFWRFTSQSITRLFESVADWKLETKAFGNVLAASAQLYGIAAEELSAAELDYSDQDYEVIIALRLQKAPSQ